MPIVREVEQTLAAADWTDQFRVELRVRRKVTELNIEQARGLAAELLSAAESAANALTDMISDRPALAHSFDLAPMCRDCAEGKHTACIGSAFVERGPDVDEVECGCSRAGHPEIAGAA